MTQYLSKGEEVASGEHFDFDWSLLRQGGLYQGKYIHRTEYGGLWKLMPVVEHDRAAALILLFNAIQTETTLRLLVELNQTIRNYS